MHYFETWGHGWHSVPAILFLIMIVLMAACSINFYNKPRFIFNSICFKRNWRKDWFIDCYRGRTGESASEMLKKKYIRGDINKEKFEQMKKDIYDFRK